VNALVGDAMKNGAESDTSLRCAFVMKGVVSKEQLPTHSVSRNV